MKYRISILLLFFSIISIAQVKPQKPKLELKNFEFLERNPKDFEGNRLLRGNVIFEYNGDVVYCDSAVYYENKNTAVVWSNVRLVSKDKTITAKKMEYDATTTIAKAWGDVKFVDKATSIDADFMEYNRTLETAHALGNVHIRSPKENIDTNEIFYNRNNETVTIPGNYKTIDSDGTMLDGKDVIYNVRDKSAIFNSEVYITSRDYLIYSRKMSTNDKTGLTTFRDYTKITSRKDPSQYIITKDGDFNKKTGEAWLRDNSEIYYKNKKLTAKEIYFNDKKGYGKATGDVFLNDPDQKMFIKGDFGEAFRDKDSAYVTKNAYAVKAFEKDSLYIHADTLMAVRRKDKDSTMLVKAYRKARFYKSNLNGKTDSLVYNRTKGEMDFYGKPILFSGENQLSGEFIKAYFDTKTDKIDSVNILNNAFAISKVDSLNEVEFNQIKGRDMTVIFYNDEIDFLRVIGNAVALSYMDDVDEKTKIKERFGIDITYCGIIEADVVSRQMELVACRIKSNGKTYPESQFPEELRYLPDFKWRISEKLGNWKDIFTISTE